MNDKKTTKEKIEDALISLMSTTDVQDIRVKEVVNLANVTRATFYRHYDSVGAVIQGLETALLEAIRELNKYFVSSKMSLEEPDKFVYNLTKLLFEKREFIKAINGPHGDPQFLYKATKLTREFYGGKIAYENMQSEYLDFYIAFALGGHNSFIDYWLRIRPEVDSDIAAKLIFKFMFSIFKN